VISGEYSLLIIDYSPFRYLREMKWIGTLGALVLIVSCFFPWVFIESKNITVTGIESAGTSFGKPGYFHFFLGYTWHLRLSRDYGPSDGIY